MKVSIPEISWHNREPVLSVDIQPQHTNNHFYRVATGGSDNFILIWKLNIIEDGNVDVSVLCELTRHQKSVNVVKWSPNGEMLASGDDDGHIILWRLKTDNVPSLDERENEFEERWTVHKVLRGHCEDVYDVCWSPKCHKLLSGSVDNTAILWDINSGKSEFIISDHKGFVQGVAWDPKSQYVVTLSSDRICRIFTENGRKIVSRIGRGTLPVDETHELYAKEVKYFHDDTFKTYFRRLCFSPDGNLLLVPSGSVETNEQKNILYGTFAFSLESLKRPIFMLPSGKQCSIVVKCCPILFDLRENGPPPIIELPYRMIIAIATDGDVLIYDTQQHSPCVHLQNIHYTRLTDLTWSADGLLLAASSTDGFITLVTFKEGELGTRYVEPESEVDEDVVNVSALGTPSKDAIETSVMETEVSELETERKPSFLEQWAKKENQKSCDTKAAVELTTNSEIKKRRITPILISKEVSEKFKQNLNKRKTPETNENANKTKKRIQPIKIGEVSKKVSVCISAIDQRLVEEKLNNLSTKSNVSAMSENANLKRTPTNACKTPKSNTSSAKSSSTKKKKLSTPSLLEFFKPISKTPNETKISDTKTVLNPKKLFSDAKTEVEGSTALEAQEQVAETLLSNDNSDVTEDLVLQVEDSDEGEGDARNSVTETTKPPRRVPFTTLSSPKNKRSL